LLLEFARVLVLRGTQYDTLTSTQRPLHHVRDFLNCVRSRRETVADPEDMYKSMMICLAADICEQLKRNLKFDLLKTEFAGDPDANRLRSRAMRQPWCV
jgi:predicted dehydrogenase